MVKGAYKPALRVRALALGGANYQRAGEEHMRAARQAALLEGGGWALCPRCEGRGGGVPGTCSMCEGLGQLPSRAPGGAPLTAE